MASTDYFTALNTTPQYPLLPLGNPTSPTNDFQRALQISQPSTGVSPEYQRILDNIKAGARETEMRGTDQARSLAARRGITGSSTEQFGVQEAIKNASEAAMASESNVLLQNQSQQEVLKQLQAKALFERSIYGDQLAFANYKLGLEQVLGQQSLDIARQNIDVQRDIADRNAKLGLIGEIGSAFIPGMLPGIFGKGGATGGGGGGGGGLFSKLFNIGGNGEGFLGFGGGGSTAVPYGPGSTASSSLFPGGLGSVGTNAPGLFGPGGSLLNTAGTAAGPGLGSIFPALAGYGVGRAAFGSTQPGDQAMSNLYSLIGAGGGSFFGPAGTAIGSSLGYGYGKLMNRVDLGLKKSLGNTVGGAASFVVNPVGSIAKSVKKVFPY